MTTRTSRRPVAQRADQTITRAVKALRAAYDITPTELARMLDLSYETVNRRLNGNGIGWSAGEVAYIARIFRQSIEDLYAGRIAFPEAWAGPQVPPMDGEPDDLAALRERLESAEGSPRYYWSVARATAREMRDAA